MESGLKETFSVDDVVAWLNVNGFEDVSETFYAMCVLPPRFN